MGFSVGMVTVGCPVHENGSVREYLDLFLNLIAHYNVMDFSLGISLPSLLSGSRHFFLSQSTFLLLQMEVKKGLQNMTAQCEQAHLLIFL